jgi:hypothetical protein
MNALFTRLFIPAAALLVAASSFAQQVNPDAGFVAPSLKKTQVDATPIGKPAPYDINGVVAQAFKTKKPLELVNPLAPQKYGDGQDSISWDPDNPEKPKGIILFGVQW